MMIYQRGPKSISKPIRLTPIYRVSGRALTRKCRVFGTERLFGETDDSLRARTEWTWGKRLWVSKMPYPHPPAFKWWGRLALQLEWRWWRFWYPITRAARKAQRWLTGNKP